MELKTEQDANQHVSPSAAKPMALQVQAELRAHGLDALLQRHKLTAKRHARYSNLVLLKYAANDFNNEVMKECRGILLDESRNWEVVGCPFFKFMNQDERGADPIEWPRARVYEKLDGSICMLYFYDGKWHVASSGSPDASGAIGKQRFEDLFWDIWKNVCKYQEPTDTGMTYLFEMLTPRNPIVCSVAAERIVLIGVRRLSDLHEELPEVHAHRYGWEVAKSFPLTSLAHVLKAASELNGGKRDDGKVPDEEGYIVCDTGNFNRVKVKSPKYVALAHLKGRAAEKVLSDEHLLPLVLADEVEEMSAYFPHLRPRLEELACAITCLAEACANRNPVVGKITAEFDNGSECDACHIRAWLCQPGNVPMKELLRLLGGFLTTSRHTASPSQDPMALASRSIQQRVQTLTCIDVASSQKHSKKQSPKQLKIDRRPDPNAPDGDSYTRDEFLQYYGAKQGATLWEAAAPRIADVKKRPGCATSSSGVHRRKR